MSEREKIFKDSVHGYISVPNDWCSALIDTAIFQRLRCIEQTSMRCLYPSARHDRFIHSLGVYHLGRRLVDSLFANSHLCISKHLSKTEAKTLRSTFLIACLLHDCAHAPFSHTFEDYYNKETDLVAVLEREMQSRGDQDFPNDSKHCSPAAHEVASAIILLQVYEDSIRRLGADPCLAARMIVGCSYYQNSGTPANQVRNAFISLLNGSIDVDKLDYIVRDTWASGVNNTSIDLDRLLSSVVIMSVDSQLAIAYKPTALSVIQSVVEARNYLYSWIYSHHKVAYNEYLLTTAVAKIGRLLTGTDDPAEGDGNLAKLFSLATLTGYVTIGSFRFTLLSDGDIIHLLKHFQDQVEEAHEWLTRHHRKKPLWKSKAVFRDYFGISDNAALNRMLAKARPALGALGEECSFTVLNPQPKEVRIKENEIQIQTSQTRTIPFNVAVHVKPPAEERPLFYVYWKSPAPKIELVIEALKRNR